MPTNNNGDTNTVKTPPESLNRNLFPSTSTSDEGGTAQWGLAQECMEYEWANNPRWKGVERTYTAEAVLRLRGSIHIEHTLARLGAERLGGLLESEAYGKGV